MQVIYVNFKTKEVTKIQEVSTEVISFDEINHDSSCIDKTFYNADTETLIVRFRNSGDFYMYEDCDQDTFDSIFDNGSVGRYWRKYRTFLSARGKISNKTLRSLIA